MNYKYIFKIAPKMLLVFILIAMLIASFDGIIIATVISTVTNFGQDSNLDSLITFSIYSLLIYSVVLLFGQLSTVLRNKLIATVNKKIKNEFLERKIREDSNLDTSDEVVSFVLKDFDLIEKNYLSLMLDVISYTLMGVVSMMYLLYLNPIIAILFVSFSFLPILPAKFLSKTIEKQAAEWSKGNELLTGVLKNLFSGRHVIKTYSAFIFADNKFQESISFQEEVNKKFKDRQSWIEFYSGILSWLSYIIPISIALLFVMRGVLSASAVVAMFLASDRVIYPLRNISMLINQMNTTKDARKRVFDIISKDIDEENAVEVLNPVIEMKNISFSYGDKVIFKDLNQEFKFGEKYLITGVSGSGKTTLFDLIQGLIKPETGSVSISNNDTFYGVIARIGQEPYLFNTTIRDNIVLDRKDVSDDYLLELLEKLGLIKELGSDLLNIKIDDKNLTLSGGQKQRLEIVRAVVQEKSVLLIDEATSALDSDNAVKVRKFLYSLDSTIIEIAHHYSQELIDRYGIQHLLLNEYSLKKASE